MKAGSPGFRGDIEGLRALAVLPILFNHAEVRGFLGGFIGVDIFFVISGFLITGILYRDFAEKGILITFYRRRALRILPALFGTLAAVLVVGLLVLTPNEIVELAKSAMATSLFGSNIFFYLDSDYFAAPAQSKPLLHTWSLAVEEQFYLFWPLLILLVAPRGKRPLLYWMVAVALLSFAASVWMVGRDMPGAFYLLPFRAWEFALGGLLAIWRIDQGLPRWAKHILGIAGIAVILACTYLYRPPITFPGLSALPPVLATVAIIMAGPKSLSGWCLSLPPVRYIGRISYSVYLWHWPVIVFARLGLFLPQTLPVAVAEIIVSLVLGALSYRFLEVGLRRRIELLTTKSIFLVSGAATGAAAALAAVLILLGGLPGRFEPERLQLAQVLSRDEEVAYRRGTCFVVSASDRFDPEHCLASQPGRPVLMLIGDSTAAHLWPGLSQYGKRYNLKQATMAGCPPLTEMPRRNSCNAFFREAFERHAPSAAEGAVLLSGGWQDLHMSHVRELLADLRQRGIRPILVGPAPRYRADLPRLLFFDRSSDIGQLAASELNPVVWPIDAKLRQIASEAGVTYISLLDLLCSRGRCRVFAAPNVPLQLDTLHFTQEGSAVTIRLMMPQIEAALTEPTPPAR